MKNLKWFCLLFILGLSTVFADTCTLYTRDRFSPHDIGEMSSILDSFHETDPNKNIIFYVHGRKKNIIDEWKDLANIEDTYKVKIVMFHWAAWTSMLIRPVKSAEDSASELGQALKEISDYKVSHTEKFQNKKIIFLSHSMGNVVLRYYLLNYYNDGDLGTENGKELFYNYVSTSADVPMMEHKEWLSKINFAHNRYVTFNNKDIVLNLSNLLNVLHADIFSFKLGLGFDTFSWRNFFIENIIDQNSTYIDFSEILKAEHRYFQKNKLLLNIIFDPLFNGQTFNPLAKGLNVVKKKGIYYLSD